MFDEFAPQPRTASPVCVAIRAPPRSVLRTSATAAGACERDGTAARAISGATRGAAAGRRLTDGSVGAGDCFEEPPSAYTWSSVAVPPPDEVGVPPTVIARYSLPATAYSEGPEAIWWPVWNVQSTLPVFVSNARRTPSPPPAKPRPLEVVVTPPRSGSGVVNFQTRLPELTSIALIEPWSCQPGRYCPKLPFSSPRKTLPWTSFCFFWVGVSFACCSTDAVSAAALRR